MSELEESNMSELDLAMTRDEMVEALTLAFNELGSEQLISDVCDIVIEIQEVVNQVVDDITALRKENAVLKAKLAERPVVTVDQAVGPAQ